MGLRYDKWKVVFVEQRMPGTMAVWAEPFVKLRLPKPFDLRTTLYEHPDITSNTLSTTDWAIGAPILQEQHLGPMLELLG